MKMLNKLNKKGKSKEQKNNKKNNIEKDKNAVPYIEDKKEETNQNSYNLENILIKIKEKEDIEIDNISEKVIDNIDFSCL